MGADLNLQGNIRKWEQYDTTWEIPKYIQLFDQDLTAAQAWIAMGGTVTTLGPVVSWPTSDGELEADDSDEDLVPASRLVPKVQQDDQMQHKLDRGLGRIPWKSDRGTKSLSK